MSTILNNPLCASKYGNTGIPSCALPFTFLDGYIITEDSFKIPAATITSGWAAVLTYLKAASLATVGNRIYPVPNVGGVTDNTPAAEEKKNGYGDTIALIEKGHSLDVEHNDMGFMWWKNFRNFRQRKDVRIMLLTPEGIFGTQLSNGDFVGHRGSVLAKQVKISTKNEVAKYMAAMTINDPKALTDNLVGIAKPEGVVLSDELLGILNINIEVISSPSATTATVTATTEISKTNLYDEYSGATLLGDKANWVANLSTTGAVVTILTCTAVPGTKGFALTWATAAAPVIVKLAAPSVLAAAGIGGNGTSGFESDTVSCPIV